MTPQSQPIFASVRPATPEDARGALRLMGLSDEERFHADLRDEKATVLVLTDDETDEEILGVAWATPAGDDEYWLKNLMVQPKVRGLGFGRRLLQLVIRAALDQKAKKLTTQVLKSEEKAVQFLHQFHFLITQVHKGSPSEEGPSSDAYLLELDLSPNAALEI